MMVAGTERIRSWAVRNNLTFEPQPDPAWYERWEPFDTMVAPSRYLNSVVASLPPGHVSIVEPWHAEPDLEPLDRAVMAFATHPALRFRASVRIGEWFITRVAFVGSVPPAKARVGDADWDTKAVTFAASEAEAKTAFHPQLRNFLNAWRFRGHLELRPGGLAVHVGGLRPEPHHIELLLQFVAPLVANALAYPSR